jgi:predicted nucleic acid-binding protein
VAIQGSLLAEAWAAQDRFQLSFWDALIVASARASGADRLLTEDLSDGQRLDGLTVIDPFLHEPDPAR